LAEKLTHRFSDLAWRKSPFLAISGNNAAMSPAVRCGEPANRILKSTKTPDPPPGKGKPRAALSQLHRPSILWVCCSVLDRQGYPPKKSKKRFSGSPPGRSPRRTARKNYRWTAPPGKGTAMVNLFFSLRDYKRNDIRKFVLKAQSGILMYQPILTA